MATQGTDASPWALDHIVLEVGDPLRSLAWYRDVLGLAPVREEEFHRGEVPFASVRVSEATLVDLFPTGMWRGPVAANPNHFALTTTDEGMRAVRGRLSARGVPIRREDERNFGARGYGHSIYFEDPDGNMVEVRTYEAARKP
jgi:catechol 2,3-dioxygenase-like lactoylglutathione lyase family enzyme